MSTPSPWSAAPVGLARLDGDGHVLRVNDTLHRWCAPDEPAPVLTGRRLADLLSIGGRLYWETHVVPAVTLQGRVDGLALELRTPTGPLPVLLTCVSDTEADGATYLDVAVMAVRERSRFEKELVRTRAAAEQAAERLRWVQQATAALSQGAGQREVLDALLAAVAAHPAVAGVDLRPASEATTSAATAQTRGVLRTPVVGAAGSHGELVVRPHGRPGDGDIDPDALATIAQQGAVALDRARLHEQSMSVAHELQHAMLTDDLPARDDVTVAAEYRPAISGMEVGGDWYDAFWLDATTLGVVVGDVVGHGLAAATAMGQLRTAVRALARPGLGPGGVVDLVHRFVVDRDVGFGSTLVYAELDTTTARLTYACAGHLPPLLVHAGATCTYLWQGRTTPLGVRRVEPDAGQGAVVLAPGDVLLLCTDGVVERRDRPLAQGLEDLAAAVCRTARSAALAADAVDVGPNRRDDACVLTLSWRGGVRP